MKKFTERYGRQDTRKVIGIFARTYRTTRQRISGNLSALSCVDKTVEIFANRPHSIMSAV